MGGLGKYDPTAFEKALNSTFSLFYTSSKTEFTLSDCKYENGEVTGTVTVDITKDDQKLNFTICHDSSHGETTYNPVNFNFDKYLGKYCKNDESKLVVLEKLKKDLNLNDKEEDLLEKIIKGLNETLSDFEKLLLNSFIDGSCIWGKIMPPIGFYGAFSEEELKPDDAFRNTDLYKKYKALSAFMNLQDEEDNVNKINKVLDVDTMRGAKNIVVKQLLKGEDGKQQVTEENLSNVFYREFLKPHEENRDGYPNIDNSMCFHDFGEVEEIYNERGEKQENISFDIIKTSEKGKVKLFIKNIPENGELIIPSSVYVYDKDKKEYKVTYIDERSDTNYATFAELKTLKFTGDFDKLEILPYFISHAENLKKVEINGNIGNLTIKEDAFYLCPRFETFTIQGNIVNLTMEKKAFHFCKALRTFAVQGDVENLNLGSEIVDGFSKTKIFLSENSKNEIPENFEDKNKIIFYDITDDDTLHLKVNATGGKTLLGKEILETLGENFQNLRAMDLKGNAVEIIFDDDLKDKFLKVEDKTGLHYERKRV